MMNIPFTIFTTLTASVCIHNLKHVQAFLRKHDIISEQMTHGMKKVSK